ncbi:gfo/Idh/MocA family oxidoreductase [Acidipropionibacterium jensenii]|uniref:Gfo/Idh/MocA family protein n=1 Tax=Acidipropionibacterium jensenii TaxID=1749 RepID=UPI000BC35E73|nr:Gfo/Idh/MocA family oxidoreductase [Acidipropionibacterium jensenii]AZZ42756.1 gfo/Idh/MocA family oxidoreductase [Acidipropionibacterium jensenii]
MISLATIGTSAITEHLLDAVADSSRIRHTVVHSRSAARGRAFADQVGVDRVVTTLEELAGSGIDAVYIASPNALHHDQARAMLRAGKHVLVEKSACVTPAGWQDLVDLARARGLVLLEANRNSVWHPGTAALREALPRLGRIRLSQLGYCQRSTRYDRFLAGQTPGIFDPAMGAGALMDIGTYALEAMIELFGQPPTFSTEAVLIGHQQPGTADRQDRPLDPSIDGAGVLTARYPGHLCTVTWSKISDSSAPSVIQGEDATLTADSIEDPSQITLTARGSRQVIEIPRRRIRDMGHELEAFADAVEDPSRCSLPQRWTAQRLDLMAEIRRRTGVRLAGS